MPTEISCAGSTFARAFFRYEGEDWQNVVSRNPPITVSLEQKPPPDSAGKCDGIEYTFQIELRYPQYPDYVAILPASFAKDRHWGPIGGVRLGKDGTAEQGKLFFTSRGWSGAPIEPYQERLYQQLGSGYTAKLINLVRSDNQPDNCGSGVGTCVFTVSDVKGRLFQKEAENCPEYKIECEKNCPPGTVECCGCCLDCSEIAAQIKQLTNLVRGI